MNNRLIQKLIIALKNSSQPAVIYKHDLYRNDINIIEINSYDLNNFCKSIHNIFFKSQNMKNCETVKKSLVACR